MTDQLNKLTDEEVRVRVANILFPQFPTYWDGKELRHRYPSGSTGPAFNYPADLNAMHEAEKTLSEQRFNDYVAVLVGIGRPVTATARQRALEIGRAHV